MSPTTNHQSPITLSDLWIVVPVRGIAEGKSRLAGILDPTARARLNERLLSHTLKVIGEGRGDLRSCVVVSPCSMTREMAAGLGTAIVDEGEEASGLNTAVALGRSYARRNGARRVLVLPCDLPYLTAEALAAVATQGGTQRHLLIAPDRQGTGTNALQVSALETFEFRFGEQSFARHMALAVESGWSATVCRRSELEFDLDTPEDFERWTEARREAEQYR